MLDLTERTQSIEPIVSPEVETAENGATREIQIRPTPFVERRAIVRYENNGRVTTYTTDYSKDNDSVGKTIYRPLNVLVEITQPIEGNISALLAGVELSPGGYDVKIAHGGLDHLIDVNKRQAKVWPNNQFYDVAIFRSIYGQQEKGHSIWRHVTGDKQRFVGGVEDGETFGPDNNSYLNYEYGVTRVDSRLNFRRTSVSKGETWTVSIPDNLNRDKLGLQSLGDEKQWSNIGKAAGIVLQGPLSGIKIAAK